MPWCSLARCFCQTRTEATGMPPHRRVCTAMPLSPSAVRFALTPLQLLSRAGHGELHHALSNPILASQQPKHRVRRRTTMLCVTGAAVRVATPPRATVRQAVAANVYAWTP
jgi:hypothetical protein